MLIIDVSIVNVALPTIERDLHFTDSSLQWVASAYALTFGGFLLLGGRMADLLGRRKMFMVGLAVFSVASLACGFASTSNQLIAARAVQGLGAALIAPAALSILTTTFAEGEERNKALGVWGAVSGAGGAVGVLLGGVLTQWAGWEWVFFVNVPIGVIAILLAPRLLHESRVEDAVRSFDVIGAVTRHGEPLAARLHRRQDRRVPLVLGPHARAVFAVSMLLMAIFLINEQRAAHPLLPLSIFRLPTIVGANVVGFMLGAAIFSMFFLLALYMQRPPGLHYTALRSGIGYLLVACTIIVSAGASQALRGPARRAHGALIGLVLLTLGLLFFSRVSPHGVVPRRSRAGLRARRHRPRLRVHPRHDRRADGHQRTTRPGSPRASSTRRSRSAAPSAWRCSRRSSRAARASRSPTASLRTSPTPTGSRARSWSAR